MSFVIPAASFGPQIIPPSTPAAGFVTGTAPISVTGTGPYAVALNYDTTRLRNNAGNLQPFLANNVALQGAQTPGGAGTDLIKLNASNEPTLGATTTATSYQGGAKPQARAVSGVYTLDASGFDEILEWDLSGGAGTFTLPAPSATYANRTVMVQIKGSAGGNTLTTSVSGGSTINGAASQPLNTNYGTQSFRCLADGSAWQLLV